ncbi:response regulator [Methylorubrum salsuginis]|uniref:Response regulator receiver domain-containing protein n=1 Tax=Methylorubrum salsuginis TaxID=414703 RepID=A0A1I4J383_9HYPH|nr:response regulator [Methylorubrum salsuginis]SFL61078.1 Response regulator receiver domain-containing protein [Methylorubrum salsuginis]
MVSRPTILIVEDNYLLLEMLTHLCEQEGIAVLAASSGEAALTMLRDGRAAIDWLFTDINLPGLIDGWEVAAAYRERHPQRPVIYASTLPRLERRTVPGSIYVRKPFQIREILSLARMMAVESRTPEALRATG